MRWRGRDLKRSLGSEGEVYIDKQQFGSQPAHSHHHSIPLLLFFLLS